MRARPLVVAALALCLAAGGPAWAQATGAGTGPQDLFERAGVAPADQPLRAPGFTLPDLNGGMVSLGDLAGRLVVVNFWATWCRPCIHEMPTLDRLAKRLGGQGLSVLAVSMDTLPAARVADFVEGYGWTMPVLLDTLSEVADAYAVRVVPTTYLIAPDGAIVGRSFGPREWDSPDAVALMESLLHPSEPTR
jgi:peroxiredoxin